MPAKVLYDMVFNQVRLIFDQVVPTKQSRRLSAMLVDFMERGAHEAIVEALSPKEDGFNVIAHADCWSNNLLFRGEKNIVLNVVDRHFLICTTSQLLAFGPARGCFAVN